MIKIKHLIREIQNVQYLTLEKKNENMSSWTVHKHVKWNIKDTWITMYNMLQIYTFNNSMAVITVHHLDYY